MIKLKDIEQIATDLGLYFDTNLDKSIMGDTRSFSMYYDPIDTSNCVVGGETIVIMRYLKIYKTVQIWDDYIIEDGKAFETKGRRPTVYKQISGVREHVERILKAYRQYVLQIKEETVLENLEELKEDFE